MRQLKLLQSIFSVLLILIVSSIPLSQANYNGQTWNEVKDKAHAFVFRLDLIPMIKREALSLDEFLINDRITGFYFECVNFPVNISSISFKFAVISPNGTKVYESPSINTTSVHKKYSSTFSPYVELNKHGIWFLDSM